MTRFLGVVRASCFVIGVTVGFAQQPGSDPKQQDQPAQGQRADDQKADDQKVDEQEARPRGGLHTDDELTPLQQREKEIRRYDPLDTTDPISGRDSSDRNSDRGTRPSPASRPLPGSVAASSQSSGINP